MRPASIVPVAWMAVLLLLGCPAKGAVSLDAKDAVFKSTGTVAADQWQLSSNGYVGTFLHLDSPGSVTLTLRAASIGTGPSWPLVDLHVGNQKATWSIDSMNHRDYSATFPLPAGTHFVRAEYLNGSTESPKGAQGMLLSSLRFEGAGATLKNRDDAATIADAADSYIENFRKGSAWVTLRGRDGAPLPEGTAVHVKLRNHAFNFGVAVSGTRFGDLDDFLSENPAPGSDAALYQQAVKAHFNLIVPEDAGKWLYNEASPNKVTMGFADHMVDFAQQNGLRMRMLPTLWAGDQQPEWADRLLHLAKGGVTAAKNALREAISSRIKYYLQDRARRYVQVEGINETFREPLYLEVYGDAGVAAIYNEMVDSVRSAGGSARVYFNDYDVFGADYGEWYRQGIQHVVQAGITPQNQRLLGVGIQNYTSSAEHNPADIYKTLHNLASFEDPITLSEFGVEDGDPGAARLLLDNMRLVFGSDQTDTFVMWGFWKSWMWKDGAALFDTDWNLTEAGRVYEQLLGVHDWGLPDVPVWDTDLILRTDGEGRIDFRGFYGDYDLAADGATVGMSLTRDVTDYRVVIPEPSAMAILASAILVIGIGLWGRAGARI